MRPSGQALTQNDLCPYKSRLAQIDSRAVHTQRGDNVRTQQEDGHLQVKERGLGETKHADTLILNF